MTDALSPRQQPVQSEHLEDEVFGAEFKPMTAEEAAQWRSTHKTMSPWAIIGWQCALGCVMVVLAALWGGAVFAQSLAYGVVAVVLPAALMVRGLRRKPGQVQAGDVMARFVVWEMVKIAFTIALLVAAPKLVLSLNWLALVLGFVVTMKVYWVAAWQQARRQRRRF